MGIAAAVLGSAVIGGVSSIIGGNQAAKGQEKAARIQAQQFQETKELLQPFIDSGELALEDLQASIGLLGPEAQAAFFDEFQTDPGFEQATQFGLDQVQDRFELSGRGGGNLLAALSDRARNDLFGQFQIRQNQLAGLADIGRSAAGSLGSAGQQSAAAQGAFLSNAGALRGGGIIGAGNAITGGIDQLALLQGFGQGQANAAALNPFQTSTVPSNQLTF